MPRLLPTISVISITFLSACGQLSSPLSVEPRRDAIPRPDAGTVMMTPTGTIIATTYIREDFDNLLQVDTASTTALIDVNRGLARVPSIDVPEVNAPMATVMNLDEYKGVVEAGSILVPEGVSLRGTDAVELRAGGELRISGHVRAGPGGVTLIAGTAIRVDGLIESEGPIRLRVSDASGEIEVSGMLRTLATGSRHSGSISLLTRGTVTITGELTTGETDGAASGEIEISTYGLITVSGSATKIATGDAVAGNTGDIRIATEDRVDIMDGAAISCGRAQSVEQRTTGMRGGSIDVRATWVAFGNSAQLRGGAAASAGGSVRVTSAESITTASFVLLEGGPGDTGGDVDVAAKAVTVGRGTMFRAGAALTISARVLVDIAGDATFAAETGLRAGAAECGDGGPVVALVGGRLTVDPTTTIRGGEAGGNRGGDCLGSFAGGDVTVFAQQVEGDAEAAATAGAGVPNGTVAITVERNYTREPPDISVRPIGWVISRIYDRGEDNIDRTPQLIDVVATTPEGTFAKIQLAGAREAKGPFSIWQDSDDFAALSGMRYFRYRAWLKGRALDSPLLDRFELNLAP